MIFLHSANVPGLPFGTDPTGWLVKISFYWGHTALSVLVFNILWLNASLFWLMLTRLESGGDLPSLCYHSASCREAWHLLFGDSYLLAVSWWPWTSIKSISNSSCSSSTHKTFISVLSNTHVEAYISQATASSFLKPHCHCKHESVQGKEWEGTKPSMADVRQMLIHLEMSG